MHQLIIALDAGYQGKGTTCLGQHFVGLDFISYNGVMVAGISTLFFQGIEPCILPNRQVIMTICLYTISE